MRDLGLTVGQLRAALVGVTDDMGVVVRASSERDEWSCGGITHAGPDTGCVEDDDGNAAEFFAIEVDDDDGDFATPEAP